MTNYENAKIEALNTIASELGDIKNALRSMHTLYKHELEVREKNRKRTEQMEMKEAGEEAMKEAEEEAMKEAEEEVMKETKDQIPYTLMKITKEGNLLVNPFSSEDARLYYKVKKSKNKETLNQK